MKMHFPNSAFLGNIDPFIRGLDLSDPGHLEITANKNWISIHPVVLSMAASLALTVKPSNIICEKLEAKSKHYLARMGLFDFLKVPSGMEITEHEPAGRFIPLTQITNAEHLTRFITEMIPLLHLEPKSAEPIRYIISELVRNVLEHACTKHGAIVSTQYYQKSNSIRLGIVDTGIGIKNSINESYNAPDDLSAIQLALTPGITGTTQKEGGTEQNAGAGLFFIKSIAAVNRDFFMIYSGRAMYKLLKGRLGGRRITLHADPFVDRHSKLNDYPAWPGTAIGIDLTLDNTNEFSLLLDLISSTYAKAIRERKKAKYRRARFI